MSKVAKSLHLWDHHETSIASLDLSKIDFEIDLVLDKKLCAAEIAWNKVYGNLNPGAQQPWFIKHIRDRDLWEWKHPQSKNFGAAFYEVGMFIETLDELLMYTPDQIEKFYDIGKQIQNVDNAMIDRICKCAEKCILKIPLEKLQVQPMPEGTPCKEIPVIAVNSPIMRSEVGNALIERALTSFENEEKYEVAFVYRFSLEEDQWWISIRTGKNGPSASEICSKFGGGGHQGASGMTYRGHISDILTKKKTI